MTAVGNSSRFLGAAAAALTLGACTVSSDEQGSRDAESEATAACAGVERTGPNADYRREAAAIARSLGLEPAAIKVEQAMRQQGWTFAWATPPRLERGVFIIRRGSGGADEVVETWGGVATPDERDATARWARDLPGGPPVEIARCFAREVTSD